MGNWKVVFGIIGLVGSWSMWQHRHVDYQQHPPTIVVDGAARDTLNAAYAEYQQADSTAPFVEQGFCAKSWSTIRTSWNTTVVHITSVTRSETNASPISVSIPCAGRSAVGGGIVFHTHPPQRCVVKGNWEAWSECQPQPDQHALCQASYRDLADTLQNRAIPARLIVCGEDHFVLYHATDAL